MLVATVNFTFKDSKGKESDTRIRIPSTFTFAQYALFAQAAAEVISQMTTAEIVHVSVSLGLDLSGLSLKSVATQFADWFNKALIQARNSVSGLFGKFNLPTYDEINNLPNSRQLDQADPQVAALITLIEDGITVGPGLVYAVTARNEALSEVTLAEEVFRKS